MRNNPFDFKIQDLTPQSFKKLNADCWTLNNTLWDTFEEEDPYRVKLYTSILQQPELVNPLPSERWIDFGCGAGHFVEQAIEQHPLIQVVGMDINCHENYTENSHWTFVHGDLETPRQISNKLFNRAFCIFAAFELTNLAGFFANVYKNLEPGGSLFLVVLDTTREFERLLTDKIPKGNYELLRVNGQLTLGSHFTVGNAVSPAPYFRILYPHDIYINHAISKGFNFVSLSPIVDDTRENGPIATLLKFTKPDM